MDPVARRGGRLTMETATLVDRAQSVIGYRFRDPDLIVRALTHASVSHGRLDSNERLEFLGDAVLGMVACEKIYELFPDLLEGEMTKIKSVAVSRRVCARIARSIGLEELMLLGKGLRDDTGGLPHSLAAAALESTIAAVHLDGGIEPVRAWLWPLLEPHITAAAKSGHQQNYKSVLQQHVQRERQCTPHYRVVSQSGPDHAKTFVIAVEIAGETYEPAEGMSKKQAEQRAALNALGALELITRSAQGEVRIVRGSAAIAVDADTAAMVDLADQAEGCG
ncbi:MAG: ribonuclease III [Planctomycetota bacterium]